MFLLCCGLFPLCWANLLSTTDTSLTGWGQTGVRSLDRRVPLLAYKLPGAESCLPGTDLFSPLSQGLSWDFQDGQHGGSVSCKTPVGFTVAHPTQACTPSPPLVSRQVPLLESS